MFESSHPVSDRLSSEEVDAWFDYCVANESRMYDEVMHGRAGPAQRMNHLPTHSRPTVPWGWMSESEQDSEILRYALE
jgi:hypothetical protein